MKKHHFVLKFVYKETRALEAGGWIGSKPLGKTGVPWGVPGRRIS